MGPNSVLDKSAVLDNPVPEYHAVVQTGIETAARASAAGQQILGICQEDIIQEDVDNGRVVDIRILGITFAVVDAAVAVQDKLRVAADGRLTTLAATTANQNVVGIALTPATAANDWITLLLTPGATAST